MSAPISLPLSGPSCASTRTMMRRESTESIVPARRHTHRGPGVLDRDVLHAGADERRFRAEQRHGLALHVRAHQRAVGVVVLEERDQRRGDRDELLGRDVDVVDLVALGQDRVADLARLDPLVHQVAGVVETRVGLGDRVAVLLPRGEVEAIRLDVGRPLLALAGGLDLALHLVALDDVADLVVALALLHHLHVVEHPAVLDLAVRALDEAELVDAREAAERRDQPDVRAFRRLDRADAAVVRRVHVAHLEAGALAAEAARAKGAQAPLVGDLRERVRLVHELAELARAEELADRRHHGLGVDEVVGHGRGHLLVDAHLFLDRALHAHEPDPELVLEQLADAPDAAVAEVVDVVHVLRVAAQLQQEADHRDDVLEVDDPLAERRREPELGVELEPADAREVVLLRVQEHALEQVARRVERRRVARPHAAVDLDQRLLGSLDRVLLHRHRQHRPDLVALGEEHVEGVDLAALGEHHGEHARRERLVALEHHLARLRVHDVGDAVRRPRGRPR